MPRLLLFYNCINKINIHYKMCQHNNGDEFNKDIPII